jgi:hypothetical protein
VSQIDNTGTPRQGGAVAPGAVENLDKAEPTRITLQLRDVPVSRALLEWSKASGTDVQNAGAGGPPNRDALVTLDARDEPALVALQSICRQAGLRPMPNYEGDSIYLQPGQPRAAGEQAAAVTVPVGRTSRARRMTAAAAPPFVRPHEAMDNWAVGPSVSNGPFLVTLTSISTNRSLDVQRPQGAGRLLRLTFAALAESQMDPITSEPLLEVREVIDDAGRPVPLTRADPNDGPAMLAQTGGGGGPGSRFWTIAAPIPVPAGVRSVTVRGAVRTTVVTGHEELTIPDFAANGAAGKEQTVGGLRFGVVQSSQPGGGNGQLMVEATIHRDAIPEQQWQQQVEVLMQRHAPQLLDANGTPLRRSNYGASGNGSYRADSRTHRFAFTTADGQPPAGEGKLTLVWRIPTTAKPIAIPVEFRDIPVP